MIAAALDLLLVAAALGWAYLLVRISPASTRKISAAIAVISGGAALVWALFWAGNSRSSYYSSSVTTAAVLMGTFLWACAVSVLWALFQLFTAIVRQTDEYVAPGVYASCILVIAAGIALKHFIG